MAGLDDLNLRIAAELEADGRASFREVARSLGVSEGTVRGRVKRMQEDGQFVFATVVDPQAVGLDCTAYVGLTVKEPYVRPVTEALCELEEFTYVSVSLGRFNVLCMVVAEDRETLGRLLAENVAALPGVTRTETMEVLRIFKYKSGRTS